MAAGPCGVTATKEYDLYTGYQALIRAKWVPVCWRHARTVAQHYHFKVRDLA